MARRRMAIAAVASALPLAVAVVVLGIGGDRAEASREREGGRLLALREVADEVAIRELASQFEITFDEGDFDGHLQTWDGDNITFEAGALGTYRGREEYLTFLRGFYDSVTPPGTRHLMTNFVVDVRGDTATMTSYLTVLTRQSPDAPEGQQVPGFLATSVLRDRLVKRDGEWRFTHRNLAIDQDFTIPPEQGDR